MLKRKFNRILYAVLSDIAENIMRDHEPESVEEVIDLINLEVEEALKLIVEDALKFKVFDEQKNITFGDKEFSSEDIIIMLTEGIPYDCSHKAATKLASHLNSNLDEKLLCLVDPDDSNVLIIEYNNQVAIANVVFSETDNRVYIVNVEFVEDYPSIIKTVFVELITFLTKAPDQNDDTDPEPPESGPDTETKQTPSFDWI